MKYSIAKASVAVMAATLLLRVFGLVREIVLATVYGAGAISDAIIVALTVPTVLLMAFKSALGNVFIPQYESLDNSKKPSFTSNMVTIWLLVGVIFAVIFAIQPQLLLFLFAPNFEYESFMLASVLLRIMVWTAVPILVTGVLRGYLQVHQLFFVSLASEAFVNVALVGAIILAYITERPWTVGIGAVIGDMTYLAVIFAFSRKAGFLYRPMLSVKDDNIKHTFRLMLPIMLSNVVLEINQIVDKNLASALTEGTISALSYASKVNTVLVALIGASVGTALLPKLSELAASNNIEQLKTHLSDGIKNLFPLLLPMTVGILLLSRPLVRVLLERGAFDPEDTQRTAECLEMYILGLIAGCLNALAARVFYAMRRPKWPAALSAASVAVGITLNLILVGSMQHRGLALATSVSNTLYFVLLMAALRTRLGRFGFLEEWQEYCKAVFACVAMGLLVWLVASRVPIMTGTYFQCLFWTVVTAGGGALLYAAVMLAMQSEWAWGIIRRLVGKPSMRGASA